MELIASRLHALADDDRPLVQHLGPTPGTPVRTWTYQEIYAKSWKLALALREVLPHGSGRAGLIAGNGPEWVVGDLALMWLRAIEVPVPLAFSAEQAGALLRDTDVCLVDGPGDARLREWRAERPELGGTAVIRVDLDTLPDALDAVDRADVASVLIGPGDTDRIVKVIHTSGTTSTPKGVRITARGLDSLLSSLHSVSPTGAYRRYLSMVPLSLLIEQVTALYLVILTGGTVVFLPPDSALIGTSPTAARDVLPHLRAARPTAVVGTPSLVQELLAAAERHGARGPALFDLLFGNPDAAPLVSCGGAPVDPGVLRRLEALGLPVHEGYGLSENSSVVAWNVPGQHRPGTVGRPLPHVEVRLGDTGELLVRSPSLCAGYDGNADPSACGIDEDGWLHTGDLAVIDADGYLTITGRIKNVIITGHGRNVAPEWVESQYTAHDQIRAAGVVGDAMDRLHALFVVDTTAYGPQLAAALTAHGRERLSEVERVQVAHLLAADDPRYHDYFTVTGRPRREVIARDIVDGRLDDTSIDLWENEHV